MSQAAERQVRFEQVYAETVKVMQKFFNLLLECDRQAAIVLVEDVFEEDAFDLLEKRDNELCEYWVMNNLYFPAECVANIKAVINLRGLLIPILVKYLNARGKRDRQATDASKAEYELKRKEYMALIDAIGKDFRHYMGVEKKKEN